MERSIRYGDFVLYKNKWFTINGWDGVEGWFTALAKNDGKPVLKSAISKLVWDGDGWIVK